MRRLAGLILWAIILLSAGLPLAWLLVALVANPAVAWGHLAPDAYQAAIFARTLLLAAAGATLATLLAIPPAALLARSRTAGLLLLPIMAAVVAMPQPAWAYGWSEAMTQAFRLARPASALDLARVAITNGAAWWPIPAAAIALAWRRLPSSVLDAAALDGARGRITARLLVGPALAGWSAALLLSAQNLSPPDQTGIVVASVIVRDTFQGTVAAGSAGGAGRAATGAYAGEAVLADQSARLAAAIAVGLPSFLVTGGLALLGWRMLRRSTDWTAYEMGEAVNFARFTRGAMAFTSAGLGSRPARVLAPSPSGRGWPKGPGEAGPPWAIVTSLILLLALIPPIIALLSTNDGFDLKAALEAHTSWPSSHRPWHGRFLGAGLALGTAMVCAALAILGTIARPRWAISFSLICFLLGGQFVALGMIRAFLPPAGAPALLADTLGALYQTAPFHVAAYVALFAWLALAAGAVTWNGPWRGLRDLAAADGATTSQAAGYVIWPLAWPGLLAATLAVFALAMTESQATALLVPGTPINFMLSNIHTQSYAPMAEAALLMMLLVGGTVLLVVFAWLLLARVRASAGRGLDSPGRGSGRARAFLSSSLICLAILAVSCDAPEQAPEAIWAESGAADGQLAYPRAIAYSAADDIVWVVDKTARVQAFDAEGNFIRGWTMPEQQYGKPVGISVDREGNIWVADTHYYRVIVYRPDGTEWFRFGEKGIGPGQFIWPTDVLVLDDGRVLVSEYGSGGGDLHSNDRIQVFGRSEDGTITDAPRQVIGQIGSFGTGEGQFRRPQSMAMVGGVLWVTDGANHRLLAFSLDGALLKTLGGEAGGAAGQFRFPYGLDVDADGNLLVSEFGNHRVQKVDPETGESLASWGGSFGPRPGQVKYPWGLAWDSKRGRVILLDSGNDRVQAFRWPSGTDEP